MKKKLMEMLKAKKEKRSALITEMAGTEDAQVRASQLEIMGALDKEIADLEEMIERAEDPATDPDLQARAQGVPAGLTGVQDGVNTDPATDEAEKRGADLKAGKAVTVRAVSLGSTILTEKKYSRDINDKFNEVSGLIDRVNSVPLQGGESYSKAFAVSGGIGDYKAENANYAEITPTFDYVEIAKAKITAYCEVTEEIKKIPNADYLNYIQGEIRKALRKKITQEIIAGAGTSNTLTGIYNAPAKVIPAEYDLEMENIDENTLNDIVFHYGGDEDVVEDGVLVLSKADLKAFADVRGTDLKPVYKITRRGNTGTIEYVYGGVSTDYIINSACNSLSAAATEAGTKTMVYGRLGNYEMPVFSDVEIKESNDYKFANGNICYRGSVFTGGNVTAYKGWFRVKKAQAAG